MRHEFTKMQSLGNDFVMLNGVANPITITESIARHIADRHFGIGCDQILLAENLNGNDSHGDGIRLRIFNSDGSEVGQCGNGARCFARFLHDQKLSTESSIDVVTSTTRLNLQLNDDESVTVQMGLPQFEPAKIPLIADQKKSLYRAESLRGSIEFSALSLGNPHCVIDVEDVDSADLETIGPIMENHALFPERVNVGFMQILNRSQIRLRVFERGVGETLGCGSGACAAVVSGIVRGRLDNHVEVELPGGKVNVEWSGEGHQIVLNGSVNTVYVGSIDL